MPVLRRAVLEEQSAPQAGLCCTNPWATGETEPALCSRGAGGQRPLGPVTPPARPCLTQLGSKEFP